MIRSTIPLAMDSSTGSSQFTENTFGELANNNNNNNNNNAQVLKKHVFLNNYPIIWLNGGRSTL